MATTTIEMKLLIDTDSNKVLFAEAGKNCVDFLFYILSIPVATVVQLLTKQGMMGSLENLYESLENLSDTYIQHTQARQTVLHPSPAPTIPLLIAASSNQPPSATKRFSFYKCGRCNRFSDRYGAYCSAICGGNMYTEILYVGSASTVGVESSSGVSATGVVKGVVTYMITDDLTVTPMSTISSITLLSRFNVKDVTKLKEETVTFGMDQALKILDAALKSKTVLTDAFHVGIHRKGCQKASNKKRKR